VLGAAAAFDPVIAAALVAAALVAAVLTLRPELLLPALVVSVFVEILNVKGVTISRLVAPVALLAVLAAASRTTLALQARPPLAWVGVYAVWALGSGLWTTDVGGGAFQLASLGIALVYMLVFAAMTRTERDLERIGLAFAFAGLGMGLFAIAAYLLGLSSSLEAGRTAGGTGDPNFFATYQVVALPLALALAGVARRPAVRLALYASAVVIVASIFTSVSRGGLVALVAVALLTAALPARTVFRSGAQKLAVVALLAVGAAFAYQAASAELAPRVEALLGGDTTGSGRTAIWMAGLTSIEERPLLGLGYGGFPASLNDLILRTPGVDLRHYELRPDGQEAHNVFVSTTADLGLPGLVILVGLLVSTGRALRRTARQATAAGRVVVARIANALVLSLVGFTIASLFLSTETSRALWILVGLAIALPGLLAEPAEEAVATAEPALVR
jgi:O-antigen ligase